MDGFVKVLKRIHEMVCIFLVCKPLCKLILLQYQAGACSTQRHELEKNYYDSLIVVLETLEKCFSMQLKDSITLTMEENQNLKSLLKEICAFLGE